MRRLMQWLVVMACLVLGLALHGRNHQPVHFDFYLGTLDLPLSVLLVGALGAGMALALLALLPQLLRQRLRLRRAEAGLRRVAIPGEGKPPPATASGGASSHDP